MWGIVCGDSGLDVRSDLPVPEPELNEVLVRVLQAGICETDLQLIRGYMGFRGILGHEFVGIASSGALAGERVVGEINCPCGRCESCRCGAGNHCPHRTVLGILGHAGAFAEWVAIPEQNLHRVPAHLSDDEATLVEPLAAACQIPRQIQLSPSTQVLVLGDGRLGNLCAQVLKLHRCAVTVIGKHSEKLKRFDALGIAHCLLSETQPQRSADVVVDSTGSPEGFNWALRFVKPRGTIVLKTTVAGTTTASWAPLVIDEITMIGSRCGPFDVALQLLSDRSVNVESLITARYPIQRGLEAFAEAKQPHALKVILEIGSQGADLAPR